MKSKCESHVSDLGNDELNIVYYNRADEVLLCNRPVCLGDSLDSRIMHHQVSWKQTCLLHDLPSSEGMDYQRIKIHNGRAFF